MFKEGENPMEMISVALKEKIQKKHPVLLDTEYCKKFHTTHTNCVGCESEVGCSKLTKCMLVFSVSLMMPQPRTLSEFLQQQMELSRELRNIIEGDENADM